MKRDYAMSRECLQELTYHPPTWITGKSLSLTRESERERTNEKKEKKPYDNLELKIWARFSHLFQHVVHDATQSPHTSQAALW